METLANMIHVVIATNGSAYLKETIESVLNQTFSQFKLHLCVNNGAIDYEPTDPRIIVHNLKTSQAIGEIKRKAFFATNAEDNDIIVELDHDDLLTTNCLYELNEVFKRADVGFVYSNFVNFNDGFTKPNRYDSSYGWQWRPFVYQGHELDETIAFPVTPASLGLIYYAPNHVRAWRFSEYARIGGHNADLPACDDHELIVRAYLNGVKFEHIDKALYLYREYTTQNFRKNQAFIDSKTWQLYNDNIQALSLKWSQDNGLLALDLGGRFNSPQGFKSVDLKDADYIVDLNGKKWWGEKKWPFKDNSVGVIRAFDLLEHLPNKQFVMKEIHRVLAPGGMLLSCTPSTDGRGAWQDPTHCAFYNENSFWYYTRQQQAQYIDNTKCLFRQLRLVTAYPSKWHEDNKISYITADLTPIKGTLYVPGYFI